MDIDYDREFYPDEETKSSRDKEEAAVRKKIEEALQSGDVKTVCTLIEENTFENGADLIDIWDQVHYLQEEKRLNKSLTPLIRFRVRKRYPPPKSICPTGERKTASLPKRATKVLKEWLSSHTEDPYPSNKEKEYLSRLANLTPTQVKTWFANARRRIHRSKDSGSRRRTPFHRNFFGEDEEVRRARRLTTLTEDSNFIPNWGSFNDYSYLKSQSDRARLFPHSLASPPTDVSETFARQLFCHNQGLPQVNESRLWNISGSRLPLSDHHWATDYYSPESYPQMLANVDGTNSGPHALLSSPSYSDGSLSPSSSLRQKRLFRTSVDETARRHPQPQVPGFHSHPRREIPNLWESEISELNPLRRAAVKQQNRPCRGIYHGEENSFVWSPSSSTIPFQSTAAIMNSSIDLPVPTRCDNSELMHPQAAYPTYPFSMLERYADVMPNRSWNSGRADMDAAKVLADLSSCPH